MKTGALLSIGHNLADSLASGICLMIGVYSVDIYGEAAASEEGYIEVDFMTGETAGGTPSPSLSRAIGLYARDAFPELCKSHGAPAEEFRMLKVRFWSDRIRQHFEVSVENKAGRRASARYEGTPARRAKTLDHLGRIRPARI